MNSHSFREPCPVGRPDGLRVSANLWNDRNQCHYFSASGDHDPVNKPHLLVSAGKPGLGMEAWVGRQ